MSTTVIRPAPAPRTGAILLFILAAIAAACWLGINFTWPELQPTGIPTTITRLLIDAAILAGLWLGLARTQLNQNARIGTWLAIAIPLVIWQIAVWWIAIDGGFRGRVDAIPALPIAIILPLLIVLPCCCVRGGSRQFSMRRRRIGSSASRSTGYLAAFF